MKIFKSVLILILAGSLAAGAYWYYHHEYVETLMLSEIVGKSDKPFEEFLTGVFDFDTGLTRHDLRKIGSKKEYWGKRMKEVEEIIDPVTKAEEMARLYNEMGDDKSMKKLRDKVIEKSGNFASLILESL